MRPIVRRHFGQAPLQRREGDIESAGQGGEREFILRANVAHRDPVSRSLRETGSSSSQARKYAAITRSISAMLRSRTTSSTDALGQDERLGAPSVTRRWNIASI